MESLVAGRVHAPPGSDCGTGSPCYHADDLGGVDREGIDEVMLWAKDLKGAFTLLRFHPSQSRLFVLGLACGLTTICPCGNFGWVGTPYAFNVVSRTLDVITEHTIESAGVWYVREHV